MKNIFTAAFSFVLTAASAQQLSGPDAPLLGFQYSSGQLTVSLSNLSTSNNYMESYNEMFYPSSAVPDSIFRFQGYMIFQLAHDSVSTADINDVSNMRPVAQCDIQDTVDDISNYVYFNASGMCLSVPHVYGANAGISHTMSIPVNPFSGNPYSPDSAYCFIGFAYAHNPYYADPACQSSQTAPFLLGRHGAMKYCFTPSALGIAPAGEEPRLSVHPNPAENMIRIETAGKAGILRIYSASGQLVKLEQLSNDIEVSVSELSAGAYYITFTNDEEKVSRNKLLVVK